MFKLRRLTKNKGGMEMAVNYLVALILGFVTLALGFYVVKGFVTGGGDVMSLTSEQLDSKISDLLCDSNDIICFSDNNQKIYRDNYAFVGMHIKNIYDGNLKLKITIDDTNTKCYKEDGTILSADPNICNTNLGVAPTLGSQTNMQLKPKSTNKMGIGIYAKKTAEKGTYSLLVSVEEDVAALGYTIQNFGTKKDRILVQIR